MKEVEYCFLFEEKWHQIRGGADRRLVEISESCEIRTPHACLEGGCGSCRCRIIEGKVEMLGNSVLSEEELASGYILACQSVPQSERVVVSFDEEA